VFPSHSTRDRLFRLFAAYCAIVMVISIVNVVAPQRGGPFALSQVFAPHLLAPVLVLAPFTLISTSRALRLGVVLALVVGAIRFGPGLVSLPSDAPTTDEAIVNVISWNLEAGAPAAEALVTRLAASDAEIVALQELTPEHASAITANPAVAARYRYTALVPREGVGGIGILSMFPITVATDDINPVVQEAELQLLDRTLTVINAHPFPPHYRVWDVLPLPFAYDSAERDSDILRIRGRVDAAIAASRAVIVLGDFNLTDREPAFDDLSRGLWDAHRDVGQGIGSTWRPSRLEFLPVGVLRIDHFLGGPGTRPLSVGEDCAPRGSDHCILIGSAALN
jgi:vancomycin resistance protein VanJ